MKALILKELNRAELGDAPLPPVAPGMARVRIKAAALNHRDLWIKKGQYANITYPTIPGSDGAGVVDAVADGIDGTWVGEEVILNPSLNWGAGEEAQGPMFNILGMPHQGTLAEMVSIPAEQLAIKPKHLSWEEAAALPLAGLTAYRALVSRARLQAKERVLISGIGGGVALFALQFAHALGAEVWVTSGSPEKIERAVKLGAKGGFRYNEKGWVAAAKKQAGGFDVIVDSAGGPGFNDLLDVANPGGRVVFYGGTAGAVPDFAPRRVFWKQLSLLGTTMGSQGDWLGMLEMVHQHRIRPIISEVLAFEKATEAFDRLEASAQFGKMVVRIAD